MPIFKILDESEYNTLQSSLLHVSILYTQELKFFKFFISENTLIEEALSAFQEK